MLTPDEERFRRENNAWYDAAYPDPCRTDPSVYYRAVNPLAAAWFKSTASQLIDRIPGYLAILDAHNIAWEEVRTTDPGKIVYSDEYQVVTVPHHGPSVLTAPEGGTEETSELFCLVTSLLDPENTVPPAQPMADHLTQGH